jgi:hypothetical protein
MRKTKDRALMNIQDIQSDGIICLPGRPPAMLDRDVSKMFETETRRINEVAGRNSEMLTEPDFRFQATTDEVIAICDHLGVGLGARRADSLPWLYTRVGCNTLPFFLRSNIARARAQQIAMAFTALEDGRIERMILEKAEAIAKKAAELQVERLLLAPSPSEWRKFFDEKYMLELTRINPNAFFDPKTWRGQGVGPMLNWIIYKRLPEHVYTKATDRPRYEGGSFKNAKWQMFTDEGQRMIESFRVRSFDLMQQLGYNTYYTELKPLWSNLCPMPEKAVQIPLFSFPKKKQLEN